MIDFCAVISRFVFLDDNFVVRGTLLASHEYFSGYFRIRGANLCNSLRTLDSP